MFSFKQMPLDEPVRLERGKKTGFYVHSKLPGDRSLVYDDQRYGTQGVVDDGRMVIWPAVAHLSARPFGKRLEILFIYVFIFYFRVGD